MEDKVEVLRRRDISGGDPRFPVSVQVERRTTQIDGREKTYVNLLISVGNKRLIVPRRVSAEVAEAVRELAGVASVEYEALLAEQNQRGAKCLTK